MRLKPPCVNMVDSRRWRAFSPSDPKLLVAAMAFKTYTYIAMLLFVFASPITAQEKQDRQADTKAKLGEYLKRFPDSDANGDGILTLDEFKVFQQRRLPGQDMQSRLREALRRFPQADANKDGSLTLEEFRDFQKRRRDSVEDREKQARVKRIAPTHADVSYGDHEKTTIRHVVSAQCD